MYGVTMEEKEYPRLSVDKQKLEEEYVRKIFNNLKTGLTNKKCLNR